MTAIRLAGADGNSLGLQEPAGIDGFLSLSDPDCEEKGGRAPCVSPLRTV